MVRPPTVALLALLLLTVALPASAADVGLPAPAGTTERVTYYSWQVGEKTCHPVDPALYAAALAQLSQVTHEAAPGGTRYDLHLESLAPEPGCPTLDLSFVSPLGAWPDEPAWDTLTFACGATGYLSMYPHSEGLALMVYADLPEGCVEGVAGLVSLYAGVTPLHPSTYMACVPVYVLVSPCVGAADGTNPYACRNGRHGGYTYVPFVLYVSRQCDWETGEDYVVVSPVAWAVWIEARASSCTLVVDDSFLGIVRERVECPAELGALLYEADWGNLLP